MIAWVCGRDASETLSRALLVAFFEKGSENSKKLYTDTREPSLETFLRSSRVFCEKPPCGDLTYIAVKSRKQPYGCFFFSYLLLSPSYISVRVRLASSSSQSKKPVASIVAIP